MRCREEHGSLPQPLQRRGAPDKRNIDVQPITALQPSQKRGVPDKRNIDVQPITAFQPLQRRGVPV